MPRLAARPPTIAPNYSHLALIAGKLAHTHGVDGQPAAKQTQDEFAYFFGYEGAVEKAALSGLELLQNGALSLGTLWRARCAAAIEKVKEENEP